MLTGAASGQSPRVPVHLASQSAGPGVNVVLGAPVTTWVSPESREGVRPSSTTPIAATPQLSLAAGSYPNPQTLTITDATPGATIYYTTNGTAVTTSSAVYSGAITVSTSEYVVAMATAPGYVESQVNFAGYFIGSSSSRFIYTLAGNDNWGYAGDGGAATLALIDSPKGTAMDSVGNLYIVDSWNNVIRKIAAGTGIITTIAGTGIAGDTGDSGPATSAQLDLPVAIAIDGSDNIYIGETDHVVRKIDAVSGVISTYAGNPGATVLGDNGPATSAQLKYPGALAIDSSGNLYIADAFDSRVRKVTASTGVITTVAGMGVNGYSGDGGPATSAELNYAGGIAFDSAGNLFISDTYNNVIREVAAGTGIITTAVGVQRSTTDCPTPSGDGGAAINATLCWPHAIVIDGNDNLYIADSNDNVIREVNPLLGTIGTIAGAWQSYVSYGGDGYPATDAAIINPQFISLDSAGNLYLANYSVSRVQKITVPEPPPTVATATPALSVPAGTYAAPQTVTVSDTTPGAAYYVSFFNSTPEQFTMGTGFQGSLDVTGPVTVSVIAVAPGYLPSPAATASYTITSLPPTVISTIVGTGQVGYSAQGGAATETAIGSPQGIAFDKSGNMYISDIDYSVVYRVDGSGNISVIAGSGTSGFSGDNGPATSAQLSFPQGIALDAAGNVYIADNWNHRVRMVSAQTGIITTVAGSGSTSGTSPFGDGGPATQALILSPEGLAIDSAGNLNIADEAFGSIRMVNAKTGIITTVAGGGVLLGDGGPATQATLANPSGLAIDASDNLYIADEDDGRIRMVSATTGIISTIAGNGDIGTDGDGGPATEAEIWPGLGIAVDKQGNVYASSWPGEVRKISKSDGTISLFAGNGYCSSGGDGGSATIAGICTPAGLAVDSTGALYIADSNAAVRKVASPSSAATPVMSLASGTYAGAQSVTITDATPNATIYYTTDGTTPGTGSAEYSGAIAVTQSETLQAIAVANGYAASAVASATYTINAPAPVAPTVTVTPALPTVSTGQPLSVTVTVSGGAGNPTATGTVTLASGNYSSSATTLSNGSASISVPAGSLSVGTDTLTVTYTPDSAGSSVYTSASGTASVSVTASTFAISATGVTIAPGGSGTSTVTVSSTSDYAGTVTLSCAVTASPASAVDAPACAVSGAVTLSASTTTGTSTVTLSSTAASASVRRDANLWRRAGGGAALAALLFLLVPRRRRWARALLGLVFIFALGSGLVACGGGGGSSGGTKTNPPANPGTTAGAYTITVTGTGNDSAKTTVLTTFTLTVN